MSGESMREIIRRRYNERESSSESDSVKLPIYGQQTERPKETGKEGVEKEKVEEKAKEFVSDNKELGESLNSLSHGDSIKKKIAHSPDRPRFDKKEITNAKTTNAKKTKERISPEIETKRRGRPRKEGLGLRWSKNRGTWKEWFGELKKRPKEYKAYLERERTMRIARNSKRKKGKR